MFDHKIVISGAAAGHASEEGDALGFMVGREVAARGGIIVTGATSGVPFSAAKGAKSVQGQVIGFSPAHSLAEHTNKYKLPTEYHDVIFFTGYDYAGRDVLLVDVADAMILVSGRIGSLHEFTSAFERHKVIGLLLHSGGLSDEIPAILDHAGRGNGHVIFHEDPHTLVSQVFHALAEQKHYAPS
ncbi:MAG: hypothetical protein WCO52_00915 [bacterium]